MKFLIIISFIIVIFLVSCAQEEIKEAEFSTLQEPVIIMNSTKKYGRASEYNKALDRLSLIHI